MRPIDADALDKAAAELPIRLPFDKQKFLCLIAAAPTVDAVGQWTIVSEELPPPGEHVLCWYEYFRYGDYNAMYQTFGIGYQYNGFWGGEVSNGHNAKVLAWMPLPQPPQMDGGAK